jgi:hypothetical protein
MAAVSAIGTTIRNILLPAKADNSIAAISRSNVDLDFINQYMSPVLIFHQLFLIIYYITNLKSINSLE